MTLKNFSNLTLDYAAHNLEPVFIGDIFKDICRQLDGTIINATLLLFLGFIFRVVVITRALDYWKNPGLIFSMLPLDIIRKGIKHIDSLLETLGIGAVLYILGIAYYQGLLGFWHKAFIITFLIPVILVVLSKLISKYRKWLKK